MHSRLQCSSSSAEARAQPIDCTLNATPTQLLLITTRLTSERWPCQHRTRKMRSKRSWLTAVRLEFRNHKRAARTPRYRSRGSAMACTGSRNCRAPSHTAPASTQAAQWLLNEASGSFALMHSDLGIPAPHAPQQRFLSKILDPAQQAWRAAAAHRQQQSAKQQHALEVTAFVCRCWICSDTAISNASKIAARLQADGPPWRFAAWS